jgi:hypothetical protein
MLAHVRRQLGTAKPCPCQSTCEVVAACVRSSRPTAVRGQPRPARVRDAPRG